MSSRNTKTGFLHVATAAMLFFAFHVACQAKEPAEKQSRPSLSNIFFAEEIKNRATTPNFGIGNDFVNMQRRYRTWFRSFGNWSSIGGSGKSTDLDYSVYGFSLGVDQQFGQSFLLGAGLGGNWISAEGKKSERRSRLASDLSAIHASVYARTTWNKLYVDLETGFGENEQTLPDKANSKHFQWNVNAEAGTWWGHGLARVEPFFGLRHVSLDVDSGPAGESTLSKTTLLGGVRYSWKTAGSLATVTPRFYGGVLQELGGRHLMNAGVFVDAPTVFTLSDYRIAETRFFFGGGFTSALGRSLDLYLRYTAEVASNHASHTALFGMNWNF